MELNLLERMTLWGILPKSENVATYRVIMELREALATSDEEAVEIDANVLPDGRLQFIPAKAQAIVTEVPIGTKAREIIVAALRKLDGEKGIDSPTLVALWDKFAVDS